MVPYRQCLFILLAAAGSVRANDLQVLPSNVRIVLENTKPLRWDRAGRLPLFILPISNALKEVDLDDAEVALRELDRRGIGYSVDWQPDDFEASLREGLRIAELQRQLGQPVAVNANACLYSFCDGSEATLHIDKQGNRFAEKSHGGQLGCPFALEHRIPVIKERIERFLRAYEQAHVDIDFIFADWEIDGPIEWNDAWKTCQRCERCQSHIPQIHDFLSFQRALRDVRSKLQRVAFGDNVTQRFPQALVGNYGVYPHGGYRHWYDYFEKEVGDGIPVVVDQRARYRPWDHEFPKTGFTFAMPVVYTWYPTFGWYDYADPDYRWFYNMLLVGSNAGQHTADSVPLIPFVHWHTTVPPENPDSAVRQFSKQKYKELLWHLLLRGHDTFFLWCTTNELADETQLVHEVYADSLRYRGFFERGKPITFRVPIEAAPVISGMRLAEQVLIRRTNFGNGEDRPLTVTLADGGQIQVPASEGSHVVRVKPAEVQPGLLKFRGQVRFPIGFYEHPREESELQRMADAGVNLVRCGSRQDLDRVGQRNMMGCVSLGVQEGATDALRNRIEAVADHPALAVWEGPDEIVWTFTAYSFLKDRAGFTRDDWNDQKKIAVDYSERVGNPITTKMKAGIQLVRELDKLKRPFWVNEAADSDVRFVRQYMDSIDITGCDYYAVRSEGSDLQSVGRLVDRWDAIGRGKPVWMVLQGFSWHSIKPTRGLLYPTFDESRFMVYDSIVHGAKGILYWGSNQIDDDKFRDSLYALTSELAAIEPLLVGQEIDGVEANVIDDLFDAPGLGVTAMALRSGSDVLLMLVNEDNHRHLGVDVTGLDTLEGRSLQLLYGSESHEIERGGLVARLQPYEVKLYSNDKMRFESKRTAGRDYGRTP